MNYHIFIVNSDTLKFHLEYMFAGTGAKDKPSPFLSNPNLTKYNHNSERISVGMIADISRIRVGDKVLFYLQSSCNNPGMFFGVFKAKNRAFWDENDSNNYLKTNRGKGLS